MSGARGASAGDFRYNVAASGAAAVVVRSLQALVSLGVSLVMARLLTPADFGVFTMVMPLGIFGMIAANYCAQAAWLQHSVDDDAVLHAYYRFVRGIAQVAAAVIAVVGFALARFYGEPRVVGVALSLALLVVLLPRGAIQEARLKAALRFPLVHSVQLVSWCIGLVAGIVAAWQGAGYWSLPLQVIVMEVLRLVGINAVSDWRPSGRGDSHAPALAVLRGAWRSLFSLRIAWWLNEQPDLAAVGRLGGSGVLGAYGTARRWAWYPFEDPFLALTEVAIASLGRVRSEPERFRHLTSRFILAMLTLSLPVVAFVTVEAPGVVSILLGDQWVSSIPFLQVLGIAAFMGVISRTCTWVLLSRGETSRLVRWSLGCQIPAVVLATVVGARWGSMGVAIAMSVTATLLLVPTIMYVVRDTPVSTGDVLHAAARPVAGSLAGVLAVIVGAQLLSTDLPLRLALSAALFLMAFCAAWLLFPGGMRETRTLLATIRGLMNHGADNQ